MIDPLSGLRIVDSRVSGGTAVYPQSRENLDPTVLRAQVERAMDGWVYTAGQLSVLRDDHRELLAERLWLVSALDVLKQIAHSPEIEACLRPIQWEALKRVDAGYAMEEGT